MASTARVVVAGLLLFELYRFLTTQLTMEQIGVWSVVLAGTTIARIADLGFGASVIRFVALDLAGPGPGDAARTVGIAAVTVGAVVGAVAIGLYPLIYLALPLIVPGVAAQAAARELLPYAMSSLWVSAIGGVLLSSLDGCQRMDIRASLSVASSALMLVAAYLLVPAHGLVGLAIAQLASAGLTLVAALVALRRVIRRPAAEWCAWDSRRARELLRYGASFQVVSIAQLLFEPLIKAMLAKMGGLALAGYYEMASRLVAQLRSILVSAYQALVPFVVGISEQPDRIRSLYERSYRMLFFLLVVYFALILASLPALVYVWMRHFDAELLKVATIVCVGWSLNSLNVPAYLFFLGTGDLRAIVVSHVAIGLLTVALGGALGWFLGGYGVLVGAIAALVIGSHVVTVRFHRQLGIPLSRLWPRESALTLVTGVTCASGALAAVAVLRNIDRASLPLMVAVACAAGLVIVLVAWLNPNRAVLLSLIRSQRRPAADAGPAV